MGEGFVVLQSGKVELLYLQDVPGNISLEWYEKTTRCISFNLIGLEQAIKVVTACLYTKELHEAPGAYFILKTP